MSKKLTYNDALKILGRDQHVVTEVLDKLSMVSLLATSPAAPGALALLGPRDDAAQLGKEAVKKLSTKLRGLGRYQRTERLVAAHGVIIIVAFFEAINDIELPFSDSSLKLIPAEQISLATGGPPESARTANLIQRLVAAEIPIPSAQIPFEETRKEIQGFYRELSSKLWNFIVGLSIHDELSESQREQAQRSIMNDLPALATKHYVDSYIRLAVDCPEFFFWANLQDHSATRAALSAFRGENRAQLAELFTLVEDTKLGLMGLRKLLQRMERESHSYDYPEKIGQSYQAVMDRPMIDISKEEAARSINIPTFRAAYINPHFRRSTVQVNTDNPATESWWEERPVEEGLERFIAAYITSLTATDSPLVLLGQPGAGKSVLMKVLAAHLQGPSFLPILVELRRVSANAPLLDQIEEAIRGALKKRLDWADFVESAPSALPVVLLDGLDELLQSTGLKRSDYLNQVRLFQREEAEAGRRVAIIVSSRIAVADQVTIPLGATVIRLEPFDAPQTEHWLTVWNSTNKSYFERHDLQPLGAEAVLAQPDLAAQPLLLLMMALYDSVSNKLQAAGQISEGDLYDRLLRMFTDREVRRLDDTLSDNALKAALDADFFKLAVVACGMFNRGRQTISDSELEKDLIALKADAKDVTSDSLPEPQQLVSARLVVGRFFFIHEAQASLDGTTRKTYEFLHATFGEFLVAAMIERSLHMLIHMHSLPISLRYPMPGSGDDLLHAVLSFKPISARRRTVEFLQDVLSQNFSRGEIVVLHGLLRELFSKAHLARESDRYTNYSPTSATVPQRIAAYTANLLILVLLTSDTNYVSVSSSLFSSSDPIAQWQRQVFLWKSQLTSEDMASFEQLIPVTRSHNSSGRTLLVGLNRALDRAEIWPDPDLDWAVAEMAPLIVTETRSWSAPNAAHLQWERGPDEERRYWQIADDEYARMAIEARDALFKSVLRPISEELSPIVRLVATDSNGNVRSVAAELVALLLGNAWSHEDELVDLYLFLFSALQSKNLEGEDTDRLVYRIMLQLRSDATEISASSIRVILVSCLEFHPNDKLGQIILQVIEENFTKFPDVADLLREVVSEDSTRYYEVPSTLKARVWLLSQDLGLDPKKTLGLDENTLLNSLDMDAILAADPGLYNRIERML